MMVLHRPSLKMKQVNDQRGDKASSVLPDYIGANLRILFVGINPGLRSAMLGHHFAGYSNRFWKVLYRAGLVPEPLTFRDDWRLPDWGLGLTNIVARATAGIDELTRQDYEAGRVVLLSKIRRHRPEVVAVLGLTLYGILFPHRRQEKPRPGLLKDRFGEAAVFLLPNPSGRNAHYSFAAQVRLFRALRRYGARTGRT